MQNFYFAAYTQSYKTKCTKNCLLVGYKWKQNALGIIITCTINFYLNCHIKMPNGFHCFSLLHSCKCRKVVDIFYLLMLFYCLQGGSMKMAMSNSGENGDFNACQGTWHLLLSLLAASL